jgi:hypothetical protein
MRLLADFEKHPIAKAKCRRELDSVIFCVNFYNANTGYGTEMPRECLPFNENVKICLKNHGVAII